jgi:hypothetical protein
VPAWLNWELLNCTRPRSRNGFKAWHGIGKRNRRPFFVHETHFESTLPADHRHRTGCRSILTARPCTRTEGLVLGALFHYGSESRCTARPRRYRGHEQSMAELGQAARNDLACEPTSPVSSPDWNQPPTKSQARKTSNTIASRGLLAGGGSPQMVACAFTILLLARGAA